MGRFLIVSRVERLTEHLELAEKYNVGFEINDFFDPQLLDDEKRQQAVIDRYLKAGLPEIAAAEPETKRESGNAAEKSSDLSETVASEAPVKKKKPRRPRAKKPSEGTETTEKPAKRRTKKTEETDK